MSQKYRSLIIPGVAIVGVVLLLILIRSLISPQALTPDEILEKEEWTKEELVQTFSRMRTETLARDRRKRVREHFEKVMSTKTEEDREYVVSQIVENRIETVRKQWSSMEEDKRKEFFAKMHEEVKKAAERIKDMSQSERDEMRKGMMSDAGKRRREQIRAKMINSFSPDERRDLAPIVREWINILDTL